LQNEGALKLYANDPRVDKSKATVKKVIALIQSEDFWFKLRQMRDLFEVIYEKQKMSESTHSTVGMVYPRWMEIRAHLEKFANPIHFAFAHDIQKYLDRTTNGWNSRFKRQVQVHHLLAYLLSPKNRTGFDQFSQSSQQRVSEFLDEYGGSETVNTFIDYIYQDGKFHPANYCWKHIENEKTFWRLSVSNISSDSRALLKFTSNLLIRA
jgi:hypothetical protein